MSIKHKEDLKTLASFLAFRHVTENPNMSLEQYVEKNIARAFDWGRQCKSIRIKNNPERQTFIKKEAHRYMAGLKQHLA